MDYESRSTVVRVQLINVDEKLLLRKKAHFNHPVEQNSALQLIPEFGIYTPHLDEIESIITTYNRENALKIVHIIHLSVTLTQNLLYLSASSHSCNVQAYLSTVILEDRRQHAPRDEHESPFHTSNSDYPPCSRFTN